jgi:predicted transcriptional regulator
MGLKKMELRKRVPNLQVGDIIFVCRKGGGTTIVGAFRLLGVFYISVYRLCQRGYIYSHFLVADEVKKYAAGHRYLYGMGLSRIYFDESIKVEDFGYTRNPQCFYRIRADFWHNIPEVIMKREGGDE